MGYILPDFFYKLNRTGALCNKISDFDSGLAKISLPATKPSTATTANINLAAISTSTVSKTDRRYIFHVANV